MTGKEAIEKLKFMRNAYQELIDAQVKSGTLSGDSGEITGEWETEDDLSPSYQLQIDALNIAINSLLQPQIEIVKPVDYPIRGLLQYDLIKIDDVYFVPLYQVGDYLLPIDKERLEQILVEYGVSFTDALADRLIKEFRGGKHD